MVSTRNARASSPSSARANFVANFMGFGLGLAFALGAMGCRGDKFQGSDKKALAEPTPTVDPSPLNRPTVAADGTGETPDPSGSPDGSPDGSPAGEPGALDPAKPGAVANQPAPLPGGVTKPGTVNKPVPTQMTNGATGVDIAADVGDQDAIRACLNLWKTHPFKTVTRANYKSMGASASIGLGGLGSISLGNTSDDEISTVDKLVVIQAAIPLGENAHLKLNLKNPKGWYCVKFGVGVGGETMPAKTEYRLACGSRLAETNFSLGANTTGGGQNATLSAGTQTGSQFSFYVNANAQVLRYDFQRNTQVQCAK
jgi:hypothetical protein